MHNRISISSTSATNSGDKSAYAPDFADLPVELRDAVDAALQECFDKIYCSDELLGNKLTQVGDHSTACPNATVFCWKTPLRTPLLLPETATRCRRRSP